MCIYTIRFVKVLTSLHYYFKPITIDVSTTREDVFMWLLKLPFKLLALPVIFALSVVYLVGKIVGSLSDFAIGLVYSLVFLGALFVVINQAWSILIGLGVIALLAFLFQFAPCCLTIPDNPALRVRISSFLVEILLSSSFFLASLASPFKSLNSSSSFVRSRSASKIR